jgi:hypothetical protein
MANRLVKRPKSRTRTIRRKSAVNRMTVGIIHLLRTKRNRRKRRETRLTRVQITTQKQAPTRKKMKPIIQKMMLFAT